jgi:hypothetical protein
MLTTVNNVVSMLLAGTNFLEHVCALPVWILEVVTHDVCYRATSSLAAAHLHSDMDLRAVELWFPMELSVQRASYDFSYKIWILQNSHFSSIPK